jgi:hypothetical protein
MAASAPLARIVERCLEKEPARRYASGKELLADLRALAGGAPATRPRSRSSLIEELKRRRVFRAILAYGVFAFAILQVVEPIMHGLHWPDAVLSYVVVALGLGFPAVVGLAWAFDVREGRIERAPAAGTFRRPGLVPILAGLGLLAAAFPSTTSRPTKTMNSSPTACRASSSPN